MTWLFLEASDVWLFRDGKPFSQGEGHQARSVFPPSPMTIQGALRSHILAQYPVEWRSYQTQSTAAAQAVAQMIGTATALGQFAMAGPFLACQEDEKIVRFTPLPADVVFGEDTKDEHIGRALQPARGTTISFQANWPGKNLSHLWTHDIEMTEAPPSGSWLSDVSLESYLSDGSAGFLRECDLFCHEARFGIAIDYAKGRAQDQMIYQAEFIRPEMFHDGSVGLLIHLDEAISWLPIKGTMGLGGEGHGAGYQVISDDRVVAQAGQHCTYPRLKLVLLTPAWFSGGWQPSDGDLGWSRLLDHPVKLVAAALQRPQHIGGWDVARNWHKPMVVCVPAGSVFFFESEHPITYVGNVLTETPADHLPFDRQGFGQAAAGVWEWLDLP